MTKRNPESGYALLMVFAMAAIVAISLYTQVPRMAFEAQRDQEQLLIDRGEQYSRAVQLFVRKFNRFPSTMDELENTNTVRTLRRRYVDPMTGKADWRILHAGPGGVILDSVTTAKKDDAAAPQTFIQDLSTVNSNLPSGEEGINVGLRRRPSEQAGAGSAGGDTSTVGSPVMVLPDGRIVPAQIMSTPNTPPGTGGTAAPNYPGAPPAGFTLPNGVAYQQNTPPLPNQAGPPPTSAANLINQILTTPRPGGINGLPGGQAVDAQGNPVQTAPGVVVGGIARPAGAAQAPQQQVIGGGLAGVASKREQEAIKTYNTRTAYNEWEFVYDVKKDAGRGGAAGGTGAQTMPPGRGGPMPMPIAPGRPPGQ